MSKLKELIDKLCPDGVEYKKLGDNNVSVMQRGNSLTKKDATEGPYPVISGGKTPAFYCDKFNREGETITVAGSGAGAGYVQYWNEPIFVCDAFSVKGVNNNSTKYLYYCLTNLQDKIYATKKGGGVPHVHISSIDKFEIPLPPIEVQEEIVRILDNFTKCTAELQAELQAREEQYEYYRNKLLSFEGRTDVEYKKLGEVCKVLRGKRLTTKELSSNFNIPVYHGGVEPIGYYDKSNREANSTMLINVGASAGTVGFCNKEFWSSDGCFCFSHNDLIMQKFLFYALQSIENIIKAKVRKAGIPTLDNKEIERISIPIPSLNIQERIVNILDKFETLVKDLSQGLPAEIEARQNQYEFYRNRLLSFKRLTT